MPIVTTVAATAGVGVVLAQDARVIDVDGRGVDLSWSENSTVSSSAKNEIVARSEMRGRTSVLSPLGVVVADLTPESERLPRGVSALTSAACGQGRRRITSAT